MCGIAGIVLLDEKGVPPDRDCLIAMIATLKHRGPDEFGLFRDNFAGLVHSRLSIIDLAMGQQPMTNEDGSMWIVFNGEIFNYVELTEELRKRGHRFRSKSDTEVILHAYEEWGKGCFERFNGQWAIAIWNRVDRTLLLSRDRVGVRPLYISQRGARIWFGSEVKAILADPSFTACLDPAGLKQVFTYWCPVAPTTVFSGIEEIKPGTSRLYGPDGNCSETTYWYPRFPEERADFPSISLPEATETLRLKLEEATRLRMLRSDVPVGSYLSGGLDSSLVAAMGRRAKEGTFKTFSIRFEDAEFDETRFQQEMAATLDSDHAQVIVRTSDIAAVFPEVIWHSERPVLRTAPAPMFILSRLVRDSGIKAVLTGEGADEMLGGYDIFREAKIREFWSRQPDSVVRPALFDRLYPYLARSPKHTKGMGTAFWKRGLDRTASPAFSHESRWQTTSQLKRFFNADLQRAMGAIPDADFLVSLPSGFLQWDLLCRAQYLEDVTLLSGYLISSQGDRMLMANSVEGRFPFLDKEVMDFCNSLPPSFKIMGLNEKFILKRVAQGMIPQSIIRRPKQPYRAPDAASFFGDVSSEYVRDLTSPKAIEKAGIFNPDAVDRLFQKCSARMRQGGNEPLSNTDNMAVVGILSTQLLHSLFMMNKPRQSSFVPDFAVDVDCVNSEKNVFN